MDCSCWQLLAKAQGCRGMVETSCTVSAFSQKMFPVPTSELGYVRCCWRLPFACVRSVRCWICLRLLLNPYKWEAVTAQGQSGQRQVPGELLCAACLTLCLLPGLPAKHNIPFSSMWWGQYRSVITAAREWCWLSFAHKRHHTVKLTVQDVSNYFVCYSKI